jgi:hypothetical protein
MSSTTAANNNIVKEVQTDYLTQFRFNANAKGLRNSVNGQQNGNDLLDLLKPDAEALARQRAQSPPKKAQHLGPIQGIDRIYYINIDNRTDKRDFMESWLKPFSTNYSIPYERISARTPQIDKPVCRGVTKHNKPRCRGGKALKYTNLRIMEQYNTTGYTLVLEDDYQITNYEKLLNSMKNVPNDWDVVRFDCWTGPDGTDPLKEFPQFEFGYRTVTPSKKWYCGGTHATLWRSDRLHILRKIWEFPRRPNAAIDCLLSDDNIVSYCVQANIGDLENKKLASDMEID